MPLTTQQKETYKIFSQHGSGDAMVEITATDVVLLIHIAYLDVHDGESAEWFIKEFEELAKKDFFCLTPAEIASLPEQSKEVAVDLLQRCGATTTTNILFLYLKNLAELYRRRFKFYRILCSQPFPQTEQIGPRCLLEYGRCEDTLLFDWMSWRKLIYDIDNRSAQETGYLFEPILASCLGGEPVSAKRSPVKRIDNNGAPTKDGRQVDCYIEDKKEGYELKMRVTIAASGQGRFNEELSFPYEARMAGLTPILVVFDSTHSPLLEKLQDKYIKEGGRCVIGDSAWTFLTQKAGSAMGKYILKYIKPPIEKMENEKEQIPGNIHLSAENGKIVISNSNGNEYEIPREMLTE